MTCVVEVARSYKEFHNDDIRDFIIVISAAGHPSQMSQVARDIDVGKDSGIVDLDVHDIGSIALQQTPGTVITMQCQQFIVVTRGEPDRMAAPAGAGWSSKGGSV